MVYILPAMSLSPSYTNWAVTDQESFLQKAKDNLCFAEKAKNEGKFDIEANRIYYALHQLACELVRLGKMTVADGGDKATKQQPYRLGHGKYLTEIYKLIGTNADYVYQEWSTLRGMADYDHESIASKMMWLRTINKKRISAFQVAEKIYEKLHANS